MAVREGVAEGDELVAEGVGGVAVVVEVDFDFPEAVAAELRQAVEVLGGVVLRRVEEGVAGRASVAVAEASELARVLRRPSLDPLCRQRVVGPAEAGLVVVGDADEDVKRLAGPGGDATAGASDVGDQEALDPLGTRGAPDTGHGGEGGQNNGDGQ